MDTGQDAPARPLWERLEDIRVAKGWTKVQLARAAGVDRTTIEKWQSQPRTPLPPTVKLVADRLGIPHEEALRLAGISRPKKDLSSESDVSDVGQAARDRVLAEIDRDPELAVMIVEMIARIRGEGPGPAQSGSGPNEIDESA